MAYLFENSEEHESDVGSIRSLSPELDPVTGAPRRESLPPTELAQRYGESQHRFFRGTGKSGITPTSPLNAPVPRPVRELRRARHHERIQRARLLGFATWELKDSGCYITDNAQPSDLVGSVAIHPLFQLDKWINGVIPIGNGYPGVWEGQNSVVWDALGPSLRLATTLLTATRLSPWYVSVLNLFISSSGMKVKTAEKSKARRTFKWRT